MKAPQLQALTERDIHATSGEATYRGIGDLPSPLFLTVHEAASLLRTTRKAVYALIERQQLPGVTRIGRRVLIRTAVLLHWLDQKRAPSPKE
jgi:excisionase family DNA binding protein